MLGLDVAEAAFNPTPGDANGVDQDLYEERGNEWVRLVQCFVFVPREECFVSRLKLTPQLCLTTTKLDFFLFQGKLSRDQLYSVKFCFSDSYHK